MQSDNAQDLFSSSSLRPNRLFFTKSCTGGKLCVCVWCGVRVWRCVWCVCVYGLCVVWACMSVLQASACNTDTTPNQPHRNSNTHRTKNKTTNVVIQQDSRKLLMMDILMSETCWAHKKWNKIGSDSVLVFYTPTITMIHGPKNMRFYIYCLHCTYIQNAYPGKQLNHETVLK